MKLTERAKKLLALAGYSLNNESSAIAQLVAFAAQNSGIERANYYSVHDPREQRIAGHRAYSQEARSIAADWSRFKAALIQCAIDNVTSDDLIREAPHAFSGRLEWKIKSRNGATEECPSYEAAPNSAHTPDCAGGDHVLEGHWEYCTGQYFPTEYRKAAAVLLEAASRARRRARPPELATPSTIEELKALNRKNGGCWFEPAEMRFFGTRIHGGIQFGRYFITSEQPPHGARAYSVRSFDEKGGVETVGEFCSHHSQGRAQEFLIKVAKGELSPA